MKKEIFRVEYLRKNSSECELENINFNLFDGEIIGVIVRNDAERTCLFNILSGSVSRDGGNIYINDSEVNFSSINEANSCGLYSVGCDSSLFTNMSISENMFLTKRQFSPHGIVNHKLMYSETQDILRKAGFGNISANTAVRDLSLPMMHIVEILKGASVNSRILIIDDVTRNYTESELSRLKELLQLLVSQGTGIIFLSNKFNDMFDIAKRAVIIRNGVTADILPYNEITRENILPIIAGHSIIDCSDVPTSEISHDNSLAFSARNINIANCINNLSFTVGRGDVLGIYDVDRENGTALANAIFGQQKYSGSFFVEGKKVTPKSIYSSIKHGIGMIDETTDGSSLFCNMDLNDNVTIMLKKSICPIPGIFSKKRVRSEAVKILDELDCTYIRSKCGKGNIKHDLSKSTQMQITVAKWLCCSPKILIFVNPYINFDDLNINKFNDLIGKITKKNISVIIISMNRKDLEALCNKIIQI